MRQVFLFLIPFIIATTVKAQDYKTAVGGRFGASSGITLKHFIKDDAALEGILAFRFHGFNFTGLYEKHFPNAFRVDRLNWYVGAGGNIGIIERNNYRWYDEKDDGSALLLGIDGIIGMEYNFEEVPLNISLDWKPMINLTGVYFWGDEFALSVRYAF